MFTKNFNSLPDSLIEATKKIMTEASNEAPSIIKHLTQEEIASINELMGVAEEALNEYVVNSLAHQRIAKERDAGNEAMKVAHNAPDRAIGALQGLHDRLSSAHPEHKVIRAHLASAIDSLKRAQNAPNDKERTQHIDIAGDTYQKAHKLLGAHLQHNAQLLSRQGVNINSEFVPEEVNEALSPEAKKRRDKLKADVRAAKDAYRQISKQAKSPKSGLAPLKTSVTPKEHESEDPEESARKHPIDRLRRIALSMKGGHFEYDNGEKHHISRDVARAIVKHYEVPSEQGGLKPYEKEKIQNEITKSHGHMMKHYDKISETNEDAYVPEKDHKKMLLEPEDKKNKKELDEVPIETIKQIRTYYQNEESDDEKAPYEPDNNAPITWKKCDREAWVADMARGAMKKQMKTEQVKPGGVMAPKIQVPEGKIVNLGTVHNPKEYPNAIPDPTGNLQRAIRKLAKPQKRYGIERSDSPTSIQTRIGEEPIDEREMTSAEIKKREKIVKRLKDKMAGFEKNYAERAKDVMYATATKMAMKDKGDK